MGPSRLRIASLSKSGVKRKLEKSAAYPRDFGMAIASLMVPRQPPLVADISSFEYVADGDDLGCLQDILEGSHKTWWRKL
jgi:hypothetical protein